MVAAYLQAQVFEQSAHVVAQTSPDLDSTITHQSHLLHLLCAAICGQIPLDLQQVQQDCLDCYRLYTDTVVSDSATKPKVYNIPWNKPLCMKTV